MRCRSWKDVSVIGELYDQGNELRRYARNASCPRYYLATGGVGSPMQYSVDSVRRYSRPFATAGVEWHDSLSGLRASISKCRSAASTTTSPFMDTPKI